MSSSTHHQHDKGGVVISSGTTDSTVASPPSTGVPSPSQTNTTSSSSGPTMRQKLIALLALAAVSTAVGFFTKRSQVGGRYKFHPASAVVCTEMFKLVISLVIICKLILRREVGGGGDTATGENDNYDDEGAATITASSSPSGGECMPMRAGEFTSRAVRFFREEVSLPMVLHTAGLAVSYSVVNIVTYAIFIHASGSMFFLLKASSPVVTALLLYVMVSRAISKPQWIAVVGQCLGLLTTQVNPCVFVAGVATAAAAGAASKGTVISTTGYALILINIAISCTAGVWNDHVVKTYGASVNAQNVVLYSWGIAVNFVLFMWAPPTWMGVAADASIPTFFEGFNYPVLCVICANGSVGLVITAVYKYADVVVKTFGLAGSTVALFLLELAGLIPGTGKGVPMACTVLGASVVFYAAYLYILPKDAFAVAVPGTTNTTLQVPTHWGGILKTSKVRILLYLAAATVMVVVLYYYVLCPQATITQYVIVQL